MAPPGGYLLVARGERADDLLFEYSNEGRFAEAVSDFSHPRSLPLLCFLSFKHGQLTHIAKAKKGFRAGTGLRRLNILSLTPLNPPIGIAELRSVLTTGPMTRLSVILKSGGRIPPETFLALVEAVQELRPDMKSALDRYGSLRRERIDAIAEEKLVGLALQKDSLALAMSIAGFNREDLLAWEPPAGQPESFLDGLDEVRLREDAMVASDLTHVPGFELLQSKSFGAVVFENDYTRLTVAIANHLPLEQQLGVDLLYFNERFRSFVFVQYKAMEVERDAEDVDQAVFRFPQAQMTSEIARMDAALKRVRQAAPDAACDSFRISDDPFFLKFCPRVNFDPDKVGLVPGIYLPLGYWKAIEADGSFRGPRGGAALTYGNVRRHLTGSWFVEIVSSSWVGTTPAQSSILIREIRDVLGTGRALTIAIENPSDPDDAADTVTPVETNPGEEERAATNKLVR